MPSSSMLILAPVFSTISRITLPPVPITSRILSVGIFIVSMRGANSPSSARAPVIALLISPRMCRRPSRAWASATRMISSVMPAILMSICSEVTPSLVPATLKSMSPRWSSSPRMSERTAKRSPSRIRPMAMPAVGRFSGTPASISASDEPQTVAIEDEPFELGDLRHDADRVGELRRGRQHRTDRAPGELAVADLAPAGRAHAAGLADRIGREVVVEQEALLVGAVERVDVLLVLAGAERRHHQRLRLAAGEQGRAVGARQHADLRQDRPDGRQVAAVDAAAVVEDVPAHDLGLGVVERLGDFGGRELGLAAFRRERRHHLRLDGVDGGVALLLLGDANRRRAGRLRRPRARPSRPRRGRSREGRAAPWRPSRRGG